MCVCIYTLASTQMHYSAYTRMHYKGALNTYTYIYTHKQLQCSSTLQSAFILFMNTVHKHCIQVTAESEQRIGCAIALSVSQLALEQRMEGVSHCHLVQP